MENTARLFNCARCRRQVAICSHCDRGNIDCGPNCSQQARRESMKAAGGRYQHSRRGRFDRVLSQSDLPKVERPHRASLLDPFLPFVVETLKKSMICLCDSPDWGDGF